MTGLSARFPYSQADVVRATGASMPQVKKLATRLLRKKGRGTGNHLGFNFEDTLRIAVARELLRVGVDVSSIHSLFAAIETPKKRSAHRWSWLRTEDAYRNGAALVLFHASGAVCLTTAVDAVALLKSTQTVTVIDVGAIILELERQTGEQYTEKPSAPSDPAAA